MIVSALAGLAAVVAALGWVVAAVHVFLLLGHVAPPNTAFGLLFQGYKFFSADTFLPSGRPLQKRMLQGMGVFVVGAVSAALISAVGSAVG